MTLLSKLFRGGVNNYRCYSRLAATKFRDILSEQIAGIKKAGTYKTELVITSSQGTEITVNSSNKKILNFCSDNFLGLSNNKEITDYLKMILDKYGTGLSSVRNICGTQDIHKELEKKLSQFHNRSDTILYVSSLDANSGLFEAVLTADDAIFFDELNNASLTHGIRLCKAKKYSFKHRDLQDLEKLLSSSNSRLNVIVTDGIFAINGNMAPLANICEIAEKNNALVFIDDCNATGIIGKTGRGTEEYHNVLGRVDVINSTLSKALGGAGGGYTTGPKELIDLLRQKSKHYLISNSLPPPVVAAGIKVMDMILQSNHLTQKVQSNSRRFRGAMTKAGFIITGEIHPICPVVLSDARLASIFADQMLGRGIYVNGLSDPLASQTNAAIRVHISAAHTTDDIDHCVAAFKEVGTALKVINKQH